MAEKNRGISPDLLIHPGETISDVIEERGITQKELARRSGVSEAFLSDVIHGKKDISKGLAMGLEYSLGVPRSFWLNLQANYDAELLGINESDSIQIDEKDIFRKISEITDYLAELDYLPSDLSEDELILESRRCLRVSNLTSLSTLVTDYPVKEQSVLGAWLCLCKLISEDNRTDRPFTREQLNNLINEIKSTITSDSDNLCKDLKSVFSNYGICLNIIHSFDSVPAQGYIAKLNDGTYQLTIPLPDENEDTFLYVLFHEMGHIANGDISRPGWFIDIPDPKEPRDVSADSFANDSLMEQSSYESFVQQKVFTYAAITEYARTQNVPPFVVVSRLQKEGIIPDSKYSRYRVRLNLARTGS